MSEIVLGEPLASQIREAAETQGVAVEEVIEAAWRQYRFQAQRAKIDAEVQWWRAAAPELRAHYAGEFVAVHNRQVVDHDRNEETLRRRIRTKYGKTAILVTPAEGRREWRMVSTGLTRA
jgi:hypothetical protein